MNKSIRKFIKDSLKKSFILNREYEKKIEKIIGENKEEIKGGIPKGIPFRIKDI